MPLDLIKRMVQFRVKQQDEPLTDIFADLSAPARHALQNNGIKTLPGLAKHTEAEILSFHGIGKTAIPILQKALKEKGLKFKKGKEQF
jgi:DNA-directed RNA polymerase alpha subunit